MQDPTVPAFYLLGGCGIFHTRHKNCGLSGEYNNERRFEELKYNMNSRAAQARNGDRKCENTLRCCLLPRQLVWLQLRFWRLICRGRLLLLLHRLRRLQLPGPDATSAPTSAGYLAASMRISMILKPVQTGVLALLAAGRLAAIINLPAADG